MSLLNVGDAAPEFNLQNQNGRNISSTDFLGRQIVIWFYPRASTPGWTKEGIGFRDRIQQFSDKNAVVFGVSNDNPGKNLKFQQKYDFPFDLLSDESLEMSVAYGAADTTSAGKASRISYVIGVDGNISKVYDKVKAESHPQEVLQSL